MSHPTNITQGAAVLPVRIDEGLHGVRLDRALAGLLPRNVTQPRAGPVAGGTRCARGLACTDASDKVSAGQVYVVTVPPAVDAVPEGEDIPLSIVYEDGDLLVIDKAAGMTVHPAPAITSTRWSTR